MRRAGACPRRQRGFIAAPTKFPRTKAFPLGGRWLAAGETDEGRSVKATASGENPTFSPLISQKSKIFASFSPGRSQRPLRHGFAVPPLPKGAARRRAAAVNSSLIPWWKTTTAGGHPVRYMAVDGQKTFPRGEGGPAQAGSDEERRNLPKRMHQTTPHLALPPGEAREPILQLSKKGAVAAFCNSSLVICTYTSIFRTIWGTLPSSRAARAVRISSGTMYMPL